MAELAASFLAGAFALRLASLLAKLRRRRRVKRRLEAAARAREEDDLDAVIANYEEAYSLTGGDPGVALALGWAYAETGRPRAQSFLNFRYAAQHLAARDRLIEIHGVDMSLRGVASVLALTQAGQVLARDDLSSAWREEIENLARGALSSLERAAIVQLEKPGFNVGERELSWRPRLLSGAANYYLAARVARSVPFASPVADADRVSGRATAALERARVRYAEAGAALDGVARRWAVELSAPADRSAGPRSIGP